MSSYMSDPAFSTWYKGAHTEGVLSAKVKELLHIAVTAALRCEP